MGTLNQERLYKLSDEELKEKTELVTEYIQLLKDYTSYDCGTGWKPEYAEERKRIKTRLLHIRRELGI